MGERAPEAEQRFLFAAEHACFDAGGLVDASSEFCRIRGISHGACGDDLDAFGAQLPGQRHHALDGGDGGVEGGLSECP